MAEVMNKQPQHLLQWVWLEAQRKDYQLGDHRRGAEVYSDHDKHSSLFGVGNGVVQWCARLRQAMWQIGPKGGLNSEQTAGIQTGLHTMSETRRQKNLGYKSQYNGRFDSFEHLTVG